MKALRLLCICILLALSLAACTGKDHAQSTRSYILTTGYKNGSLVYLGVGGEINGVINPTLQARPGETITVMLINGGDGTHNLSIPAVHATSERVTQKGERAILTFTVPHNEIDLEYHDSTHNHDHLGMVGILRVTGSIASLEASSDSSNQQTAQSAAAAQDADGGEQIFQQKCASCHTIGGGTLVGPDLQGVTEKREMSWLRNFIQNPDEVIASGDPIATSLLEDYNNIPMPNQNLTDQEVDQILAFLTPAGEEAAQPSNEEQAQQAGQDESPPAQMKVGDPAYGEILFTGEVALRHGGTPCISCHSTEGVGSIGGGTLGPDLTHVFTRYGEQGLAASLEGLPFPTMQGIYADRPLTENEKANLMAFFKEVDQKSDQPHTQKNTLILIGAGSGLAATFFAVMLFFWPQQRMSISNRLRKFGKL